MPPEGSSEITTSIGGRCKVREDFSRPVLISREAWPVFFLKRFICVPASRVDCRLHWGGYGGGETPLPIPNREVKPSSADGTAGETRWESRSPPLKSRPRLHRRGLFFCVRRGAAAC